MIEEKLGEKKVRGFAGLIKNSLKPLNNNNKFKEKFKNTQLKVLLNASNINYAALIVIDKGTLFVESVRNSPKENLKKKKVGWDAFLQMDTQIFLAVAMDRISTFRLGIKILTGKVKISGLRKLLVLKKMFILLSESE